LTSLQAAQKGERPDFFDFHNCAETCRGLALIVPRSDNASTQYRDQSVQDRYETGDKADCRTTHFINDNEVVVKMLQWSLAGSVAAVHVDSIGRARKKVSGCASFRAIRGQHFGKDAARVQVDSSMQELRNMTYKGESRNWNFQKHCNKAIELRRHHDLYAKQCGVPEMSEYDLITHFLDSFPEDCNNATLKSYVAIIKGARDSYPTFAGSVLPYLKLAIPNTHDGHHGSNKRHVASASTQDRDSKMRRGGSGGRGSSGRGQGSPAARKEEWGQLKRCGDGVKGKVEGLHYRKSCWALMSHAQQAEAIKLRQQKSARRASSISSQQKEIDALKRTVAEMSSARESPPRSRDGEHSSRSRSGRRSHNRSGSRDRRERGYSPRAATRR
jgi:hypothetical protein